MSEHRVRPQAGAATALRRSRKALVMVDFINPLDFPGADALAGPALRAAARTARLRAEATRKGVQVIYANDNYGIWQSDFRDLWRRCRAAGGASREIALTLRPGKHDLTILKPRHSAFYCTCERLIVTGVATDNCILFSAMDAYVRGFEVWVPQDRVAAQTETAHLQALDHMRRVIKAHTVAAFGVRRDASPR